VASERVDLGAVGRCWCFDVLVYIYSYHIPRVREVRRFSHTHAGNDGLGVLVARNSTLGQVRITAT
jgi:hypothetical protein